MDQKIILLLLFLGINYTTYTTFRSPLTPDDLPPAIPEPDYEPEKTLERIKKKKSVSFVEDISKKEEQTVKKVPKKPPESILKDSTPPSALSVPINPIVNTHCQHGKPILRPALVGDKYMQPIERIPRLKVTPNNTNNNNINIMDEPNQQILNSNNTAGGGKTVVKVMPEDKIRIEVPSTSTVSLNRSNR